ncbi:histone H4 transcription factor isoform X2 [Patella vulgata]|nr:histone H4 transcription factor isoform X2 [Patella vulgata]XP_050416524.1 histone H4 transcription factor isoform X2 [Patella vulgata]
MRHHVNHYKCPFCDMTCPAPSGLRSHIRYRHTQEKPFKCGHCSHSAKSAADLRRHLDSHNETALFRCQEEDCNFDARTYPALASHHLKVHQNSKSSRHKYACHVCERKFSRGTILTKHLKTKHKFKWPSGHSRFRYKLHDDGYWRLQTVRYESIEVTDQYLNDSNIEENTDHAAPIESAGNQEADVAMETETSQVALERETDESDNLNQEHYNLDLLGQVALQNSQSSDQLKTISIADIHQSEDQENTRPVFINVEHAGENVPMNQSVPNNPEYTELTSNQSLVYEDQSGTVLQTLSVVSVSNACLDMPVIYSESTGN